ncbi:LytR/AlgR family response regulator transcription factor [Flavihumibacter petaseus]|uniref:Putative two-component response regulator n=1 Tax=Flavihumibacter petaseus NBRC 106054 TaxID=1220578 RepID=A0A0E9N0X2_9BACT|nr:LytTR family DNA-binding domain-containing protein [Flavihumibacter petaseus]GAO43408.1 putative two-component response regulator [Flavihumibacter petaseus NBRC 106054]
MLQCWVIDDEPLAIRLLEDHLSKVPFLEMTASFSNPMDALLELNKTSVDLIFLDIQMPQLNGIQFMELLRNRAMVIVTSAYHEYAINGFEHNVVDYLLKPISFERFYRGVEKAYNLKVPGGWEKQQPDFSPASGGYIFVKVDSKRVRVELDDIFYIQGLKNYVCIVTRTRKLVTLQTMKQLEELLSPSRFVRIHKSYFVALDKVDVVERQQVYLLDKAIPVGSTYLDRFNQILSQHKKSKS